MLGTSTPSQSNNMALYWLGRAMGRAGVLIMVVFYGVGAVAGLCGGRYGIKVEPLPVFANEAAAFFKPPCAALYFVAGYEVDFCMCGIYDFVRFYV